MRKWQCSHCLKYTAQRQKKVHNRIVCNKCFMEHWRAGKQIQGTLEENVDTIGLDVDSGQHNTNSGSCTINNDCNFSINQPRHRTKRCENNQSSNNKRLGEVLFEEYLKYISVYATTPCEICTKLLYPKQATRFNLNDEVLAKIQEIDATFDSNHVVVCGQCLNSLKKKKVPKRFFGNGLHVDAIPAELRDLSEVEIRLISQVKLHIKIYKLCKGRGQSAMKGFVVHFPQCVEEVIEQLPLSVEKSDLLVVRETLQGLNTSKEFSIRPDKIQAALCWLKLNNPLYANVEIQAQTNLNLSHFMTTEEEIPLTDRVEDTLPQIQQFGWKYLERAQSHILRGNINQGHPIFGQNAGKQCTAIAASFIAHSKVQTPETWTSASLQSILLAGNSLYAIRKQNHEHLNVEEIIGEVVVFDVVSVRLSLIENGMYAGYLNKYPGAELNRLEAQLQTFVESTNYLAIITVNDTSMAIIKNELNVFFADSHSRGPAGQTATNGVACVLKYAKNDAARQISTLIHRNCQPKSKDFANQLQYIFTITSLNAEIIGDSDTVDLQDRNLDNFTTVTNVPQVTASVISPDDYIPSDITNNTSTLHRTVGKPLYQSNERYLDLLAFVQQFPYGRWGINCDRAMKITPLDYYQQRIMGSEKRFQSSNEFLFYALNECDRARVEDKIAVCCTLRTEDNNDNDGQEVLNPRFCMSAIRGSSSYWQTFCGDLIAMNCHLGTPTFFLTISFDDLNARDVITALYKAEYGSTAVPSEVEFNDSELKRDLLNRHPVTAARHFSYRLNKFKSIIHQRGEEIFGRKVTDFAYRIEFQARGSPHCHAVLWLDNPPDFSSEEGLIFLERNIKCTLNTPISEIVQRYQSHRHTATCFKKNSRRCRFGFPRPVMEETQILLDDHAIINNGGRFVNLKRSEEEVNINNYHPVLLEVLRCNMDIQAVTSEMAIVFYISKYMSKCEPQELRAEVQEAIKNIKGSSSNTREKLRKIATVIMRNREISAQEAAFRVCSLNLRHCSRKTVFVPTFPKEERLRMIRKGTWETGSPEFGTNIIDRYMARPDTMEPICLYEFAAHYEAFYHHIFAADDDIMEDDDNDIETNTGAPILLKNGKGKIKKRKVSAAVKITRFNPETSRHKYFYSLILLFYPFREENFCDTMDAPDFFRANHHQFRNSNDDSVLQPELMQQIDSAILHLPVENDENINSSRSSFIYEEDDDEEIEIPANNIARTLTNTLDMIASLNSEQKKLFDQVANSCRNGTTFRFVCIGAGGCGKSFLIHTISLFVSTYYNENNSLIITAPTGKAAFSIGGITVHKAFNLPVEHGSLPPYRPLSANKLHTLRCLYRNVKFIILDEFSMVNYETLRTIHLRLGELFENEEPFGNISFSLFGDLMQLRPVRGSWIFKKPERFSAEIHLWHEFKFYELTVNQRQLDSDPILGICNRLRVGQLTLEDITILQSRVIDEAKPNYENMIKEFHDAMWIFNTIDDVKEYNATMSEKLKQSSQVYKIKSRDVFYDGGSRHGKLVEDREKYIPKKDSNCGGLTSELELAVGSRVMIKRNINVPVGVVNGALGIVHSIKWPGLRRQPIDENDMPESVEVKFDHPIPTSIDNIFPVKPAQVEFIGKQQVKLQRKQLPMVLAWAVNTHVIQGMTTTKAVVDLGKSIFSKGMAYVLLSRVKTLNGLAISKMDISKLLTTDKYTPCDEEALAELERIRSLCLH